MNKKYMQPSNAELLIAGTSQQLISGVNNTGNKHNVTNISANFRKGLKWPLWDTQGPFGETYP
jgi:hypothetical protein